MTGPPARITFLWGLKRSGIHHVVNWLYANLGGQEKAPLDTDGLHPQLFDGFADPAAGVAFFNNCGRFHSRQLELGDLRPQDFDRAAPGRTATIFGLEDCALRFVSRTAVAADSVHVLVLRDPLNNLASRLRAAETRPELFRVDQAYIDLFESYCVEYLGGTHHLSPKTVVNYNRFVHERDYRDAVAVELGLPNVDAVSEVSTYGGGSSFSEGTPSSAAALMTRFREHPIPRPILEMLLERPAVREVCSTVFGYDLAERAEA